LVICRLPIAVSHLEFGRLVGAVPWQIRSMTRRIFEAAARINQLNNRQSTIAKSKTRQIKIAKSKSPNQKSPNQKSRNH
jgi:hypothetical protein